MRGFDGSADIGGIACADASGRREDARFIVELFVVPRAVMGLGDGEYFGLAACDDLRFQRMALLFTRIAGFSWLELLRALDALFGGVKKRV